MAPGSSGVFMKFQKSVFFHVLLLVFVRYWKGIKYYRYFENEIRLHCLAAVNMKYVERKTKQFLLGLYSSL